MIYIGLAALFSLTAGILAWWAFMMVSNAANSYKDKFTYNAKVSLEVLYLSIEPETLFKFNIAAIIICFLLGWLFSGTLVVAVIAGLTLGFSPKFIYKFLKNRRIDVFTNQLPDMLLSVSNAMKAGTSLNQALENVVNEESGPIKQELSLMLNEQRLGIDMDIALTNLEKRMPVEDLRLVTSAMKISREIGGNLAEIFDRLSDTLRKKLEMEGKIRSLTSQGKLQGIVMSGLPIGLAVILYQMEPVHMSRLFTDLIGWVVLTIFIIMEIIGYYFIKKIVTIDV